MLEDHRDEIERLARRVRASREKHRRYLPPELRMALGALARRVAAEGGSLAEVAPCVGVKATTLRKYMAVADDERKPVGLVPVALEARPECPTYGVVLVAPSGWRLENLNLDIAVSLLRELS